jgi:hypothetical protein
LILQCYFLFNCLVCKFVCNFSIPFWRVLPLPGEAFACYERTGAFITPQ